MKMAQRHSILIQIVASILIAIVFHSRPSYCHGFAVSPSSRQNSCYEGTSSNPTLCGAVASAPDSISGPKGFPGPSGPSDALLCSAGNGAYFGLNVQYPGLWPVTQVVHGQNLTVIWNITEPMATEKFEYFVTKPGFIEYKPLMRDDFEVEPMLTVQVDGALIGSSVNHTILEDAIPIWSGRGVIYTVWTPADSADAFYGCLDVNFTGTQESPLDRGEKQILLFQDHL